MDVRRNGATAAWISAFIPQPYYAWKQRFAQPVGRLVVNLLIDRDVGSLRPQLRRAAKSAQAVGDHPTNFEWRDFDVFAGDGGHLYRSGPIAGSQFVRWLGREIHARGQGGSDGCIRERMHRARADIPRKAAASVLGDFPVEGEIAAAVTG